MKLTIDWFPILLHLILGLNRTAFSVARNRIGELFRCGLAERRQLNQNLIGQFESTEVEKMQDELPWEQMVAGLRAGESVSCRMFWQKYGPLLEAVAHKQLSAKVLRRVGSDDVVQSACRTFFRRVSDGQFDLPDSDALWRLMCAITLTKARRVARDQSRKKRGLSQEHSLEGVGGDDEPRRIDVADKAAAPEEAVEVADQLEFLLQGLSPEECQVLDGKMQQLTNDEIAAKLGCSERTVRRLAKNIQARWQTVMDELTE